MVSGNKFRKHNVWVIWAMAAKILGNFTGNNIELCRTTNPRAVNQTVQALINASIPFLKGNSIMEQMRYFTIKIYNDNT